MAVCVRCNKKFDVSILARIYRKNVLCPECQSVDTANKFIQECNVAAYEKRIDELLEDQHMSIEDENSLRIFKQQLGLNDSDVAHRKVDIENLKRITCIRNGDLPIIQTGIQLKKSEKCHHVASVNLVEMRTRTRRGVQYTYNEVTDEGNLFITSARIIFIGTKKTTTYNNPRVLIIKLYANAVEIRKDNQQKPKHFTYHNQSELTEAQLILGHLFKK